MFNKSKVTTALKGLVGWRQPSNPGYAILDSDNLTSRSGYYINDNPFAKVEYLKDCIDYELISNADFNTFLDRIQETSIADVCSRVFNQADYIDRQLLFQHAQNKVNLEQQQSGFVGYQFCISQEKNVAIRINRVLCDFYGTGSITLYLFNSEQKTAVSTKTIAINSDHVVSSLGWELDNSGNTYKGKYYIGYVVNGDVTPYKRDYENSNLQSCITYLNVQSVEVAGHTSAVLFDLDNAENTSNTHGLNFDISVYDDYTDLIINNEVLFSRAVYLNTCITSISSYLNSLRSNRIERLGKENLLRATVEIEGQTGENALKITGLRPQLNGELKTIAKEIQKLKDGYTGINLKMITLS